jgi:carbonic anhydrase/acetyltransferase-like protein (isoleucine patch superfamily)
MNAVAIRLCSDHPRTIEPLGVVAGDVVIGGVTVRTWQSKVCAEAGFDVVDVGPQAPWPAGATLAFAEDVVFDAGTVRHLIEQAAATNAVMRASVRPTHPLAMWLPDVVELWVGPLSARPLPTDVHPPLRQQLGVGKAHVFDVASVAPYGEPPHEWRFYRGPHGLHVFGDWAAVWHGCLALGASQRRQMRTTSRTRIGKKCRIHPTALVRDSIIGGGCVIEAGASVIGSVLGDNVVVAAQTIVAHSVIGSECRTLLDSHLRRVVSMPRATLSNIGLVDVIVGEGAFMTTAVGFYPEGPGKNAQACGRVVPHIGGAIGKGAVLGARALLRAGSCVPEGALIVLRPDEAVGKFDDAALAKTGMVRSPRPPSPTT